MVEAQGSGGPTPQQPMAQVKVSDRYLQNRILAMRTQAEQISNNFVLTPEMAVSSPLEAEFICSICYNVVRKPRQCKECDRLQCTECLNKWWDRCYAGSNTKCPLCSKTKGFHTKVNNIVMSWLNQKQFKCSLCETVFAFDRFEEHMRKECELARFKPDCSLCSAKDFAGEDAIVDHWRLNCPRMKVACMRCETEFHRDERHDCVEALLEARRGDKRLIKELQE